MMSKIYCTDCGCMFYEDGICCAETVIISHDAFADYLGEHRYKCKIRENAVETESEDYANDKD